MLDSFTIADYCEHRRYIEAMLRRSGYAANQVVCECPYDGVIGPGFRIDEGSKEEQEYCGLCLAALDLEPEKGMYICPCVQLGTDEALRQTYAFLNKTQEMEAAWSSFSGE